MNVDQFDKIKNSAGFIAALDQSGGSTPKALRLYGVADDDYQPGDERMYELVHDMRARIMTSPSFDGDRILGAILFFDTMKRKINGKPTPTFLWEEKKIVPFLKVDAGLAPESHGVQLMKNMPDLNNMLEEARKLPVFGTKMRSFIKHDNEVGIRAIVDQQFEVGKIISDADLIPILEPEIDIRCPEKLSAEMMLKENILLHLNRLDRDQMVMLKLTIPSVENYYDDLVKHPNVLKVVALSGGYSRVEANELLARNKGVVASFSRALTEGLKIQQSENEFNALLNASVGSIFDASMK